MNERIQKLAKEAFVEERIASNPRWKESVFSDILLKDFEVIFENFAERIIQECITVHEDNYGVDIIGDVLKKHFGLDK